MNYLKVLFFMAAVSLMVLPSCNSSKKATADSQKTTTSSTVRKGKVASANGMQSAKTAEKEGMKTAKTAEKTMNKTATKGKHAGHDHAGHKHEGHPGHEAFNQMISELNLDAKQAEAFDKLQNKQHETRQKKMAKAKSKGLKKEDMKGEMMEMRRKHNMEVKEILTPDQFETYKVYMKKELEMRQKNGMNKTTKAAKKAGTIGGGR